jgi:hypothetical protein
MTLRTRVYVDGYNLYYGCVRKTAYKWLDIRALAAQILATIRLDVDGAPATFALESLAIKYFTAAILKNFARHEDSVPSQAAYHQALRGHLGPAVSLIEGPSPGAATWSRHFFRPSRSSAVPFPNYPQEPGFPSGAWTRPFSRCLA